MYVTGKNNTGTGTVLSSLAQISKTITISEIVITSKSATSKKEVELALNRIGSLLKIKLKVRFVQLSVDPVSEITRLQNELNFSACIISVPDHLHHFFGLITLGLSIPTLMVKPLVPTVLEANELIALAHQNNTFACVEFHKRYDETNLWIKNAISKGELGKLDYIHVDYSQRISIPLDTFKSWSDRTNIFQYLGVHYVDLVYFLTGFRPSKVMAYGVYGTLMDKNIQTYDSVHAMVEWTNPNNSKDHFIGVYNINWVDPSISSAMSDQKYKVIGTKGRIECDQKNRGIEIVTEHTGIQQINPYFSEYLPNLNGEMTFQGYGFKSIDQFIKDVLALEKNEINLDDLNKKRPSFKESLISVKVTEAVNNSLNNNSSWQILNYD